MTRSKSPKDSSHVKKKEGFSEVNELNHERNQVAKAQKEMSSQETAGVLEQE